MAFIRINDSDIVNTNYIVRISKYDDGNGESYWVCVDDRKELSMQRVPHYKQSYYKITDMEILEELYNKLDIPPSERF